MGAERLPMRRIREVLRLKYESGLPHRAIAEACGVGVGTVSEYLARVTGAGLGWPLPAELDEAALEARLFARPEPVRDRLAPDCGVIHRELRRVGVTLQLLWEEYRGGNPEGGYSYSQFCEIYRRWRRSLRPSMRQIHRAGEKTFIDFSGKRPHLINRLTGEEIPVELFVAALGASSYTYAEATRTQQLPDWIDAHTRMLEYFGGSTRIWVPDQLKSAVTRPCRYEPGINRSYQDLAAHYGAVVIPARPGKAKDKAKVESMVLVAQRWILARLRNRTFFSLGELNAAIRELLDQLNDRPMQKLGKSRRELWEQIDRPALKPLPVSRYQLAEWKPCRVNIDYHIEVERHLYSVPYQLVHEMVEGRYTPSTVEVYYKGRRVASHLRRYDGRPSTLPEHMPSSHRAHAEWTPSRLIHWASKAGPATARVVTRILESRPHPEQGYRACLGLMRLGRRYGADRLEAACERAEHLRSYSYRTVHNILTSAQDRLVFEAQPSHPTPTHDNIRGAHYYATQEEQC
jgi:transposase